MAASTKKDLIMRISFMPCETPFTVRNKLRERVVKITLKGASVFPNTDRALSTSVCLTCGVQKYRDKCNLQRCYIVLASYLAEICELISLL
jgi:radical SAM superfamily enzyme